MITSSTQNPVATNSSSLAVILKLIASSWKSEPEILYLIHMPSCDNMQTLLEEKKKVWIERFENAPWQPYYNEFSEKLEFSEEDMAYSCPHCEDLILPMTNQQNIFYENLILLFNNRNDQSFETLAKLLIMSNEKGRIFLEFMINPTERQFIQWTESRQSVSKSWKRVVRRLIQVKAENVQLEKDITKLNRLYEYLRTLKNSDRDRLSD